MSVGIAVIGVGHWHAFEDAGYLRHLPRLDGVRLVGLHDPDEARVAAVAERLDPALGKPPLYTDEDAMLGQARPDFVLALGRPDTMAATAHRLLDAGLPFLMEKPMGRDAGEVRAIAEKAARLGGFAAVPLFQRYLPFVVMAREMIAAGSFGPLSSFSLRNLRQGSNRYLRWGAPWMLDPEIAGGGCLRNFGLHVFDLFTHVLGEEAEVVAAQVSDRALGTPVEDFASVQLRSEAGVLGSIEVGNTFPFSGKPDADGRVFAADAEMVLSGRDALLIAARDGTLHLFTAEGHETRPARPKEVPAFAILRDTIENWRSGRRPVTDVTDCLRAMAFCDAAYALARRG